MAILQGLIGLLVFIGIAYIFSSNRKAINWRLVVIGISLQCLLGVLILRVPLAEYVFAQISAAFVTLVDFSAVGAQFLFAGLAKNSFQDEGANHSLGVIVAFQVLPAIIFFSTLSAALYYLGILQKVVYGIAWIMARTMRLSGAESLSAAGNIFMGQTEAPLLVKPFIPKMTQSELMALMTGGMATIAGAVLAAYVGFLGGEDPAEKAKFASYLLSASIMNAPAALVMAKIMIPETEPENIQRELKVSQDNIGVNLIDAMSNGAADGLKLALNVGGMLLAFIAIIAMLNHILLSLGDWVGLNEWIRSSTSEAFKGLSLEYILGQIGRPIAFLMGVEWQDTLLMGSLLGQKTAINEFIAYESLAEMKQAGLLQPKTIMIATYALCGFSNFASIAIQIGGIGGMAPNRQSDLSRLGLRALLGASLACFATATIAGALSVF